MRAPRGWCSWQGTHVLAQDPRYPEAHSPSLVSYLWTAEDPKAWIGSGQSLSGLSVQFRTPKDSHANRQDLATPDLADAPFTARPYGAGCPIVGTVQLDGGA